MIQIPPSNEPSQREPPLCGPSATNTVGALDELSIRSDTIGKSVNHSPRALESQPPEGLDLFSIVKRGVPNRSLGPWGVRQKPNLSYERIAELRNGAGTLVSTAMPRSYNALPLATAATVPQMES